MKVPIYCLCFLPTLHTLLCALVGKAICGCCTIIICGLYFSATSLSGHTNTLSEQKLLLGISYVV